MADAAAVASRIAFRCRDGSQTELDDTGYLAFVNDALADLRSAGWVLPMEEDETITLSDATYSYEIPADFVYLQDVYVEGGTGIYDVAIPRWYWRLGYDDDAAVIVLDSRFFTPTADLTLKIVGQKRPPVLDGGDSVEPGMEAFVRERGVAYAAAHLAEGGSEMSRSRQRISELAWQASEILLAHQPVEYRIVPGSKIIPGR